jgi:hypothetical protein
VTTLSPRRARARFKEAAAYYQLNDLYEIMSTDMPDHIHLLPSILSPTTSYPIIGMNRSPIANHLPPVQFSISIQRKLRLQILPYPCQCQWGKICDVHGDHPFHCPKNHKGRPHNMIVDRFSPALAKLLTTANIISPTSTLDIKKYSYISLPITLHALLIYLTNLTKNVIPQMYFQ